MTRLNPGQAWLLVCGVAVVLGVAWAGIDWAAGRLRRRGVRARRHGLWLEEW